MIVADGITVRYPGTSPLSGLTVSAGIGTTAVMGPSGSGKSTLLRVMAGVQKPDAGRVTIDGVAVRQSSWTSFGDTRVSVIHQDYRLVPFLTVSENLLLAAELRGLRKGVADAHGALGKVALSPGLAHRLPSTLSGGEQQRVAIARALMAESEVILADEPTGALDADNTARVASLLSSLAASEGLIVVVATHDAALATTCDRLLTLVDGRLVGDSRCPTS